MDLKTQISLTNAQTDELYDAIKRQLQKMSTAEMRRVFVNSAAPVGSGGVLTGLSSVLTTSTPLFSKSVISRATAWSFGTVFRNKVTDEYMMAVGYRQVVNLGTSNGEPSWNTVSDTVDDWFDYWDVVET